jgi:sugar lactone lactonase YvrE
MARGLLKSPGMKRHKQTLGTLAALGLSLAVLSGCSSSGGSDPTGDDAGTVDDTAPIPVTNDATPDSAPIPSTPLDSGPDAPSCATGRTPCDGTCVDLQNDNANCGGCGLACVPGCNQGRCTVTLATPGVVVSTGLTVDATRVYWTDWDAGVIASVPVAGGNPTTLATGQTRPGAIAVDAAHVYWSTETSLMTAPLAGGSTTTLVSSAPDIGQLVASAGRVYGTTPTAIFSAFAGMPTTSPTPMVTGASGMYNLAIAGAQPFWSTATSSATSLDGALLTQAPGTGTTITLASGLGQCGGLALGADTIYFTDTTRGLVMKVASSGGTPVVLASKQPGPGNVAVDATSIYWTNSGDDTLMKVPLAGGTPVTLATAPDEPIFAMVIDDTSVYWTTILDVGPTFEVMKTTPK